MIRLLTWFAIATSVVLSAYGTADAPSEPPANVSGAALTSRDGSQWLAADTGVTVNLHGLTLGLDRFSTVGTVGTNLTSL